MASTVILCNSYSKAATIINCSFYHIFHNLPAVKKTFARKKRFKVCSCLKILYCQRRSSRPPNPPIGGPRPTLGAQVSLKLLFGYVTIFSSADLFTTDLNCRKKLACDIISECYVILSRRILNIRLT